MIDIKDTISKLETINDEFNCPRGSIEDAIKVMKMWKYLKEDSSLYDAQEIPEIEEKFFPSTITAGYKIKIEGKNIEDIQCTANFIKNNVEGVKEVRMHDKDC